MHTSAGKLIARLHAHKSSPSSNDSFNYSQLTSDPALAALFHDLSLVLITHKRNGDSTSYSYRCTAPSSSSSSSNSNSKSGEILSPKVPLPEAYCEFILTIVLQENNNNHGISDGPTMTSFSVKIMAPLSQTDPESVLAQFFESCIGKSSLSLPSLPSSSSSSSSIYPHNDLVSALHGAASFARLNTCRAAILTEFTNKYGSHLQLTTWPHGSTYAFAPPQKSSSSSSSSENSFLAHKYTFLLVWSIGIHPITKSPTADAFSKISGQLVPASDNLSPTEQNYIQSFPKAFKALIKLNGLVKAVEVCHKLLYT
ncbi:uncharacterized protein SAPINGB_P003105 [Magnusiomyces paraingens]|uniref:Uncharacterized protein n=1 Tax=Magnusiomyces paraingens TaxID=2606893 RepID=A0A5E8BPM1_9ASCO|nr:uncharacterized protein SAPINGB_P003105 [Saprochaete ingens]VVT51465.1 unnamed protein product [Saprochaete ingens]